MNRTFDKAKTFIYRNARPLDLPVSLSALPTKEVSFINSVAELP